MIPLWYNILHKEKYFIKCNLIITKRGKEMESFKRVNYKAGEKNSSLTIEKTLHALVGAAKGDANKWLREQASDLVASGSVPGKISAGVQEIAINLIAREELLDKIAESE